MHASGPVFAALGDGALERYRASTELPPPLRVLALARIDLPPA